MATVKSFSFSDKNTEIAEWVGKQKSLSQSLEIAIKLAISKYGVCDLTQKRDEMFVSGEKIETSATPEPAEDKAEKHADKTKKAETQVEQPKSVTTEQMQASVKTDAKNNGIDLSILDLK